MKKIRKIAINTGGGDAPGLNAVIRAATISAVRLGWQVCGIREGYVGLIDMPREEGLKKLVPPMNRTSAIFCFDAFDVAPILGITSPEKRSIPDLYRTPCPRALIIRISHFLIESPI